MLDEIFMGILAARPLPLGRGMTESAHPEPGQVEETGMVGRGGGDSCRGCAGGMPADESAAEQI